MQRRQNLGNDYIYSICVNGRTYIGQTEASSGTPRVLQHIVNAYHTNRRDPKKTDLYDRMRQVRIMDLEIYIYQAPDYGISNFEQKYEEFCSQWVPSGGALKKNGGNIDSQVTRIDFAEIYHTMWLMHTNKLSFNTEMGGKVRSLTFAGNTNKQPILTAKTPPKEAYHAFLRGPQIYNEIIEETKTLYKYIFSPDWPKNIESKYPVYIKTPGAKETWAEYCKQQLFPKLPEFLAESINTNNLELIQNKFQNKVKKHIDKYFIQPRNNAIQYLIEQLLTKKTTQTQNIHLHFRPEDLDISKWAIYLAKAFRGLVKQVGTNYILQTTKTEKTTNSQLINNIIHMTPVRITMTWNADGKTKNGAPWLVDAPVGVKLDDNILRYESYLLFDHIYKQCKHETSMSGHITDYFNKQTNNDNFQLSTSISDVLGVDVVYMPFADIRTLSAKMNEIYARRCPSYCRGWLDFYQPMIAVWRHHKNKEPLEWLNINGHDYYYYINEENLAIVYKMNNPILYYSLQDLKIY